MGKSTKPKGAAGAPGQMMQKASTLMRTNAKTTKKIDSMRSSGPGEDDIYGMSGMDLNNMDFNK
eukprot:CAMPEP_0170505656 /NCGR_PEP_ID=MMETSP0208-20121228/51731_1 /TAXON_ID=197538 /ORGANISM="Strombidium inclinatum, Strain S3" /LENGTH=63 /DNA_ID=CAMNT_0010786669 /DNA_START=2644 /DNA_END=2835 /DNA_ORIENTATION=+